MQISEHARRRYALRVDAVTRPNRGVRELWHGGRQASRDDLSVYHAKPEPGAEYRICKHPVSGYHLVVVKNDCVVTIISL